MSPGCRCGGIAILVLELVVAVKGEAGTGARQDRAWRSVVWALAVDHRRGPDHILGIGEKILQLGIETHAAPFAAAGKARRRHRFLVVGGRSEQRPVLEGGEL